MTSLSGSDHLYELDMVLFNSFIKLTSKTPTTKMDKGFKLYASSHIGDYEGMYVTGIMEKVKVILPDRLLPWFWI